MRFLRLFAWCVALSGLSAPVLGAERIITFDSDVTVAADGELTVVETIRVRAEGREIKRGIYRDFPTVYEGRGGESHIVAFEVVEVLRDGRAENWFTKDMSNGVRVYAGEKDHYLPSGEYTYRLTYRTRRQIAFHGEFDELYWNVTGNGWIFPIDYAGVTVHLPEGASVIRKAAYTGRRGATGTAWSYGTDGNGNPTFATTSQLRAGEGLTIAVAFPKGYVSPPSRTDEALWALRDYLRAYMAYIAAGGAILLVLGYYIFTWRRVGRDPRAGTIVPRWKPPVGISPAAARFISAMGFDNQAIGAAIVSLAVKGRLTIDDEGGDEYTLRRADGDAGAKLSTGEKALERGLFMWGGSASVREGNHERLKPAVDALRSALAVDYEGAHFVRNLGHFVLGAGLSILALFGAGVAAVQPSAGGMGMVVFIATLAMMFAVNILFVFLLKAPTMTGRKVLDEIEGFRMYLATAEQGRLDLLHPPARTPQLFERYLPYAMALGVENEWGEQFTDIFAAAAVGGDEGGYRPGWYHGRHGSRRWSSPGHFAGNLGSSLGGSISSAATPPSSSSSGSGGGGSSGGGGGGGGGGGW